jgi:hypothetical protein
VRSENVAALRCGLTTIVVTKGRQGFGSGAWGGAGVVARLMA